MLTVMGMYVWEKVFNIPSSGADFGTETVSEDFRNEQSQPVTRDFGCMEQFK